MKHMLEKFAPVEGNHCCIVLDQVGITIFNRVTQHGLILMHSSFIRISPNGVSWITRIEMQRYVAKHISISKSW